MVGLEQVLIKRREQQSELVFQRRVPLGGVGFNHKENHRRRVSTFPKLTERQLEIKDLP